MRLNATTTVPGVSAAERALADELERQHPLEDLDLRLGERLQHERLRVERSEQEDVAELACEQEPRPGRAALGVVRPLHLVEDEHLARAGAISTVQQMIGAVVVDPLLARDEADGVLAELGREAPVRLLREHPQRPGVDAAAPLLQELERVVGLARVGRAEVGDDGLRLGPSPRQRDLDRALGAAHCLARCPQRGAAAGGAPSGSGASPGRVPVCDRAERGSARGSRSRGANAARAVRP